MSAPVDQFTLQQWAEAQSKPSSENPLGTQVLEALLALQLACKANDNPMFVALVTDAGVTLVSELGSKPENVPAELLMARSTLTGDPAHMMEVVTATMKVNSGIKF